MLFASHGFGTAAPSPDGQQTTRRLRTYRSEYAPGWKTCTALSPACRPTIVVADGASIIGSSLVLEWVASTDDPVVFPNVLACAGTLENPGRSRLNRDEPSPADTPATMLAR